MRGFILLHQEMAHVNNGCVENMKTVTIKWRGKFRIDCDDRRRTYTNRFRVPLWS